MRNPKAIPRPDSLVQLNVPAILLVQVQVDPLQVLELTPGKEDNCPITMKESQKLGFS